MEKILTRHAILCGSAPDGFTQKKINEMHGFLTSEAGGSWAEKEIMIFPNGVTEAMLSFVLERLKADKTEQILLYMHSVSGFREREIRVAWRRGSAEKCYRDVLCGWSRSGDLRLGQGICER
ncbi:hypothetical protein [Treponema sp. UBA6852]|uniref:hypothetical protein n=1 Tax=Treponema sp. UBA6852 TaxID=1947744 RepID=UPI0025D5715D|nr:hypothetical protein [Treponema sp. UBA6852]